MTESLFDIQVTTLAEIIGQLRLTARTAFDEGKNVDKVIGMT